MKKTTPRGCEETFEELDHALVGRARLGPEPFARILRDPRFRAVPKPLRRLAEETV